jgi:hypothetical protein
MGSGDAIAPRAVHGYPLDRCRASFALCLIKVRFCCAFLGFYKIV